MSKNKNVNIEITIQVDQILKELEEIRTLLGKIPKGHNDSATWFEVTGEGLSGVEFPRTSRCVCDRCRVLRNISE